MITVAKNKTNRPTEIQCSGEIEIFDSFVRKQSENLVAIEVRLKDDDIMIAAYGDSLFPSVILTETDAQQRNFSKLTFVEFERFKVWSADLSGDILRVCLIR